MVEACLVVFIDAYPYWYLQQGSRLPAHFPVVRPVRPGFGYSINCQTELFCGLTPDEAGYWCEYSYAPNAGAVSGALWGALDLFRPWRLPNRALHKAMDRLAGLASKDIPFSYLRHFAKSGKTLFARDFPFPSILKSEGVEVYSYMDYPRLPNSRARDEAIYNAGLDAIRNRQARRLVLALGDLDHAGHWCRPGSDPGYEEARVWTEARTLEVVQAFEEKHPAGRIVILSDHGMSPVDIEVRLQLERAFGRPRPGRYMYFVEGTILRVWTEDRSLRSEIASHIADYKHVEIISDRERIEFGVSNPAFGDIIAVTHDGAMWVPSFWGTLPSKGMHGHHPRYEKQLGILLSNQAIGPEDNVLSARQAAEILNAC
jgi:hypothetical protein